LHKVVLDPHSRQVTDMIVERGFLITTSWVLPADLVLQVKDTEIHLDLCSQELDRYPAYRAEEFESLAPDDERDVHAPGDILRWRRRYGMDRQRELVPALRWPVGENTGSFDVAIERGMLVRHGHEVIARVDHLLIDAKRGELSEVVLQRGDSPYCSILDGDRIDQVDSGGMQVPLDRADVEALPHCRCRDEGHVEAELRHYLAASTLDLSQVEASLEESVVSLWGVVSDLRAKRRAEAMARALEGVMTVENELDTGEAAAVRVRNALLSDPRTDLSAIDVQNRKGEIVLRGQVDSAGIHEAAIEIASEQARTLAVVDSLRVERDGDGAFLRARSIIG
jgi:hypothetical protein